MIASTRATYDGDAEALFKVISGLGALPPDERLAEPFLASYQAIFGWLLVDQPVKVDGSATGGMMRAYNDMRRADGLDRLTLPGRALRDDARGDAADRPARSAPGDRLLARPRPRVAVRRGTGDRARTSSRPSSSPAAMSIRPARPLLACGGSESVHAEADPPDRRAAHDRCLPGARRRRARVQQGDLG